ncbi:C4-dicarboxylate ABC transporter [Lactococcus hodotermopsidis]|uniref:C4-dicarboxylate ABC transporter n=1 Tax=Pseudolactococcus hodotermopsidis TaxID=2709157 RepID=A0A6A0B9G3_9LACT|nr:anaerobic C4-dicarboxylate transporter family protein [Lactococcus hodotermopsidis]GFH42079.1 C4-dicarboxylate ABC transporter [Lactococcus hodotermopsidis]
MLKLVLEVAIMVGVLLFGLKKGPLGASAASMISLAIMLFVFKLPFQSPATDAMLIVFAIGISSGVLDLTGGIDYLVSLAEKVIKSNPRLIIVLAPLITFVLVIVNGTANIALALEPVIAETAIREKINPKYPLVLSANAANFGVACSPAASSAIYVMALIAKPEYNISMGQYFGIVIPATVIALIVTSVIFFVVDQKNAGEFTAHHLNDKVEEAKEITKAAKLSVYIFLAGIALILLFGLKPEWLPQAKVIDDVTGKQKFISTAVLVQIFMYATAFINMIAFKVDHRKILSSKTTQSSIGAALIVFCVGWVGNVIFMFADNNKAMVDTIGDVVKGSGIVNFLIILVVAIIISAVLGAQTVVASILFPLLLSLGFAPIMVPVIVQTLNAKFIIPSAPVLLFACELDTTGETKPKNFIAPGFVCLFLAIGISFVTKMFFA